MNIKQFMLKIDECISKMDTEELRNSIHEIARIYDEKERENFLNVINRCKDKKSKISKCEKEDDKKISGKIKEIILKLNQINDGERKLDSEYNEEWDDWYNSDVDEILFYDNEHITEDIKEAMKCLHLCFDSECYEAGYELAEVLSSLEIYADGDYDEYDGSPLCVCDLFDYDLLKKGYDDFIKESLYITYAGNKPEARAERIYAMLNNLCFPNIKIENILQMGTEELHGTDEFIKDWIKLLGSKSDRAAERFIKEAQSLITDEDCVLENARMFSSEYPVLYKQMLESDYCKNDIAQKYKIGKEALDNIPVDYSIRSDIALLTAEYSLSLGAKEETEGYWIEAFKSDTSVVNYWRIKYFSESSDKYSELIRDIYENTFKKSKEKESWFSYDTKEKNSLCLTEYCNFLAFDGRFNDMINTGMNVKYSLGWSGSFMKQGIAYILICLFTGEKISEGINHMIRITAFGNINVEKLYSGTLQTATEDEYYVKSAIIKLWKKSMIISDESADSWIDMIKRYIDLRVSGIMDANHRNYYDECAAFIAALGETMESRGMADAKIKLLMQYRDKYSRRRAFIAELKKFGLPE